MPLPAYGTTRELTLGRIDVDVLVNNQTRVRGNYSVEMRDGNR